MMPQHNGEPSFSGVRPVRCPFCDAANTRKESDFGTTLAYAQFYCTNCRTMFEWLKWEETPDDHQLPGFLRSR